MSEDKRKPDIKIRRSGDNPKPFEPLQRKPDQQPNDVEAVKPSDLEYYCHNPKCDNMIVKVSEIKGEQHVCGNCAFRLGVRGTVTIDQLQEKIAELSHELQRYQSSLSYDVGYQNGQDAIKKKFTDTEAKLKVADKALEKILKHSTDTETNKPYLNDTVKECHGFARSALDTIRKETQDA